MQISIAINDALSSVRVLRIEQRKSESANDTKQNKRRQEVRINSSAVRSPQRCLIISKGAFVCLIYVAISSIVERSLSSLRALNST
ncbi:hypothetical protein T05_9086 [Trichinella murrelli]|uniref:Uncharacterized protein n=1 Tax=Trichinella murrelli TaxID=144512 RepID=A0A0V0T931_9BILA|nr:hypothetical protein T05_9086 [Trichinella murrelli]